MRKKKRNGDLRSLRVILRLLGLCWFIGAIVVGTLRRAVIGRMVTAYGVCLLLSLILLQNRTYFDLFQHRFGLNPCFEKEHFAGDVSEIFGRTV